MEFWTLNALGEGLGVHRRLRAWISVSGVYLFSLSILVQPFGDSQVGVCLFTSGQGDAC